MTHDYILVIFQFITGKKLVSFNNLMENNNCTYMKMSATSDYALLDIHWLAFLSHISARARLNAGL